MVQQLIDANASQDVIAAFQAAFGDQVEVSATFARERVDDFDPAVLAPLLLGEENKALYDTSSGVAMAAQQQAIAYAQQVYDAYVQPRQELVDIILAQLFAELYIRDGAPVSPPPPPEDGP